MTECIVATSVAKRPSNSTAGTKIVLARHLNMTDCFEKACFEKACFEKACFEKAYFERV
jgi:uncharacterized protein YjbI with pentapeptide repeats